MPVQFSISFSPMPKRSNVSIISCISGIVTIWLCIWYRQTWCWLNLIRWPPPFLIPLSGIARVAICMQYYCNGRYIPHTLLQCKTCILCANRGVPCGPSPSCNWSFYWYYHKPTRVWRVKIRYCIIIGTEIKFIELHYGRDTWLWMSVTNGQRTDMHKYT